MMNKLSFFLLLSIFSVHVLAQHDFRSGYIITTANDTVYGLVDYRGDIRNSQVCSFKKDEKSDIIEYKPFDINAYRFADSKYYVSRKVKTKSGEKALFLEFLIKGKISLYYYRDLSKSAYYYVEKDSNMVEINNDETIITNEYNDKYARKSNQYKGALTFIMNDMPNISNRTKDLEFSTDKLIGLAHDYHVYSCNNNSCIIFEKKKPRIRVTFQMYYQYATEDYEIAFTGISYKFSGKPNHSIGAEIGFSMPQVNENLSANFGLEYNSIKKFECNVSKIYSIYKEIQHLSMTGLTISLNLKYIINFKVFKIVPTLGAESFSPKSQTYYMSQRFNNHYSEYHLTDGLSYGNHIGYNIGCAMRIPVKKAYIFVEPVYHTLLNVGATNNNLKGIQIRTGIGF